jgi:hypothetical protein
MLWKSFAYSRKKNFHDIFCVINVNIFTCIVYLVKLYFNKKKVDKELHSFLRGGSKLGGNTSHDCRLVLIAATVPLFS